MSVSLLEMLENLSYNTKLGDEADYPELASAGPRFGRSCRTTSLRASSRSNL